MSSWKSWASATFCLEAVHLNSRVRARAEKQCLDFQWLTVNYTGVVPRSWKDSGQHATRKWVNLPGFCFHFSSHPPLPPLGVSVSQLVYQSVPCVLHGLEPPTSSPLKYSPARCDSLPSSSTQTCFCSRPGSEMQPFAVQCWPLHQISKLLKVRNDCEPRKLQQLWLLWTVQATGALRRESGWPASYRGGGQIGCWGQETGSHCHRGGGTSKAAWGHGPCTHLGGEQDPALGVCGRVGEAGW